MTVQYIRLGQWIAKPYRYGWVVGKRGTRKRNGKTIETLTHREYLRDVAGICTALEATILREYGPQAHQGVRGLLNAISEGRMEANVQLDLMAEIEARDRALDRMDGAHGAWIRMAVGEIRKLARITPLLTSADVWKYVTDPPEPRAMGSAFQRAKREGVIKPTRDYLPYGSHGRPIRVWESLIYKGER